MKLEYLEDVNEYGDSVVRLYDFDKLQAQLFKDAVNDSILKNSRSLDLNSLDFIEPVNCKLILHLAEEDEGILTDDKKVFFCDLTKSGYENMIRLIEPFCKKEMRSYQTLYDLDNEIDFIFSPYGESAL
ncbi:MAG TPA: hypothetical protein VF868_04515 [Bacteroidia bacterium]|jgi:hypothetical protein